MSEIQVVAAGLVIFRRFQNQIQFLLLKHSYGDQHWTPPKGHVDPGESEFETALRETEEESGLKSENLSIMKQFQKEIFYQVKGKNKRVVFWLSEMKDFNTPVKLSHEHIDYKWLQLDEALCILTHKNMQNVLEAAVSFLDKNST